jgi:ankyrin repeat protein
MKASSGQTALFSAVMFSTPECEQIVELLLSRGADVTIKDDEGLTALDRARERAQDERIISLLETAAKIQKKP